MYFFVGSKLEIEGRALTKHAAIEVAADKPVTLAAPDGKVEVLLMQGRPIGEPVAQYGPFVMNTRAELEQAFNDYRRTQFGGWPFRRERPRAPARARPICEARRRARRGRARLRTRHFFSSSPSASFATRNESTAAGTPA